MLELADAVACADMPVRTMVGLPLTSEHRRRYGGLHDAINNGRIDTDRLLNALVGIAPREIPQRIDVKLHVVAAIVVASASRANNQHSRDRDRRRGSGRDPPGCLLPRLRPRGDGPIAAHGIRQVGPDKLGPCRPNLLGAAPVRHLGHRQVRVERTRSERALPLRRTLIAQRSAQELPARRAVDVRAPPVFPGSSTTACRRLSSIRSLSA